MAKISATPEMIRRDFPILGRLIKEPETIVGFSEPNLYDNILRKMREVILGISTYDRNQLILTINLPSDEAGEPTPMILRYDTNGACIGSELDTIQTQLSELEKIIVEMVRSLIASA